MSDNEQEQYLQWVGAQTIAQQAAEQQLKQPVDNATAQRLRSEQILMERNLAAQQREHEEAVKRDQQAQAAQQKKRDDQQKADAVQLEHDLREEDRMHYLRSGGHPDDLTDTRWKKKYPELLEQRLQAIELRYRQTSPAYGAF